MSHPDADHYNHLATIFEGIQAKKVYFGGCLQNMNLCGFNIVQPIGTFLQNNDVTYNLPAGGSSVIVKTNDLNINILTANTGYPTNSRNAKNQYSIVNEVSFIFGDQTARIFLPGDGSGETMTMAQNNMVNMDGAKPLATDWVYAISQHHGAATHGSNDVSWYNFIGANSITHSAYGKYSHPRCEVVEALESLELINTPRFPANPHQFKCGQGASMPMKTAQIAKAHHFSTAENGAIIYDWYDDGTVSWTFDTGY
jgi:beta-lactamase superfamily II metal-dependent hydrolase